jgi:hypothetical protein
MAPNRSRELPVIARPSIALLGALASLAIPALAIPAAANASRPPNTAIGGGYGAISLGHVTAKRTSARVPLRCSGTRNATCFVIVTMSAAETLNGQHRRVGVGGTTVSLHSSRSATIRIPLYPNAKRYLAAHHRLRVKLTAATAAFKTIATASITFTRH